MTEDPRPPEQEARADATGQPVGSREPSFIERGKMEFLTTIREAARYGELRNTPYGLKPVMAFMVIGTIASFDGRIFGQLLPEITTELDLDPIELISILNILGLPLILATIALAYFADRTRRVPYVAIGSILSGVFSLVTAGVSGKWALGASRTADGISGTILGTPIASLNADYYPVEKRGKVFALQGVLGRASTLALPLIVAGLFNLTALTWRLPFLITGPLMILGGIYAWRVLDEPVRGYFERRALGVPEEAARTPEEPVSLGEAWRTIWAIRTIRRLFVADIVGNAGDFIFATLYAFFLFEQYGLDETERALITTLYAVVLLPFGFLAGGMVDVILRRRPSQVLVFTGLLGVASSLFLFVQAAGPPLWVLIAAGLCFSAVGSLIGPASAVLGLQILPAHVRTLGGSLRILADIPATLVRGLALAYVQSRWGVQGGLFVAAPFILLSSIIALSAAGFYERDLRAAMTSQMAALDWRRAKETGQAKMLVCRNVEVEYSGVQVLFGVDFDVEEGEIIALLGTNGAGKSTLLKAIAGIQEASDGAIVLNGREITHMPPQEIATRGAVLMPGGRGVFPGLSVRENLELANWTNDDEADAKTRTDEVYEIFPVLRERGAERASSLSGGEQQMLSLAQAFLSRPQVLMIDELSLGLSPAVVEQLLNIVRRIHEGGTTVILVEQSVNVALTIAEKAVFMEKGEVRFAGPTEELLRRPDILRAVYVKGTGSLTDGGAGRAVRDQQQRRAYELSDSRVVLQVDGLTKSYGGVKAVDGVSFDLREGEVLGLIGPNGAGKTTIFDLISGYQIPEEGQVMVEGRDITRLSAHDRAKLRLVRRFQDAKLFPSLSVYENILVALESRLEVKNFALTALQVPQARASERRARTRADRLIELLELGGYRDKFVRELSTGLRRITDLACVLAAEPKILLLDEPSTGIAQAEAESLAPLLRRVRHEIGCSILIIEHDMPLISKVSDELIALEQGKFVMRGRPEEVLNDERVVSAYLGGSEDVIQRSGIRSSQRTVKT